MSGLFVCRETTKPGQYRSMALIPAGGGGKWLDVPSNAFQYTLDGHPKGTRFLLLAQDVPMRRERQKVVPRGFLTPPLGSAAKSPVRFLR